MARIPLGKGAYNRTFSRGADIVLLNRFIEADPTNQTDGLKLLARPGTTFENALGAGPIRKTFTLPSVFAGDLFLVSGTIFYRYSAAAVSTAVTGVVTIGGNPSMAGVKGAGYERIFIADGQTLQYYGGQAYGSTLTYTAGAIVDDVVVVDGVYYKFTEGSVDTGTPAGTLANPWRVNAAGTDAQALSNLRAAINATGTPGTTYSTLLTVNSFNPRVVANANTATTVSVRGRVAGALAPVASVSVTVSGGADGLAWGTGTLVAGANVLYGVATPDAVGIVSVTELGSFILCVQANAQRVYFIRPGETTIDPLDFFEAESETDDLIEAITVGDQVWLIGLKSIEPWYLAPVTDPTDNPFQLVQGRPFSIGALEGTVVKLNSTVFLVGSDGIVYRVQGGPEPISNPGIAERIRKARKAEKDSL